jgi:hypothetical protein
VINDLHYTLAVRSRERRANAPAGGVRRVLIVNAEKILRGFLPTW